jgi:DNA-binding LacI/PurR family transcriptional regulator
MTTKRAVTSGIGARTVAKLAGELRQLIQKEELEPGSFMPTERELSTKYRMGKMTTRRALKLLETEGLVVAVPRQGYRILGRAGDPDKGSPLAFISTGPIVGGKTAGLMEAIQRVAARRGWGLLVIDSTGRTAGEIMQQLRTARACGAILGTIDRDLLRLIREAGIPAIADDAWPDDVDIDVVTQDGFRGGMLGTAWLISQGHKRIAFLGLDVADARPQIVERYSGFLGTMARAKVAPAAVITAASAEEAEVAASLLLSRADRPTGIVAPWRDEALGVLRAAQRLGLVAGRDFDLVGWCTQENYENDWRAVLAGGPIPPVVTWSVVEGAETMIARLEQRRKNPNLPTIHLRIPVRLRFCCAKPV